ncbi:MAG: FAD/NAD(P)-binding protein [Leptospiraceae bacterium]|nr:FAD/NAD(P)-binding protein [Leptospiraceae bacterium]
MNTIAHSSAQVPAAYRIAAVRQETHNIYTLELRPVEASAPPAFQPGQFNMIYHYGVGEVAISISGDPGVSDRLIHTIRTMGLVTRAIEKLKAGAVLGIRGPYGRPWPVMEARDNDLIIVAGGVGLAPLRPVLYYVLAHRSDYRRVSLIFGARSPMDILFKKELEEWRSHLDLNVEVTVDTAGADWYGHVGVVTKLINRIPFEPQQTVAMLCGPEIMMQVTGDHLVNRGVPTDKVFLSMERNMKCAVGFCGHCQYGPHFICRDGPVFSRPEVQRWMQMREV